MASSVTLVGLSGYAWGNASDETAVNLEEMTIDVEPELREELKGINGMARGFAVGSMMVTVQMNFEIGGSTGIMAAVTTTAFAPVNSIAYFAAPSTGLYLTKGTVTRNRSAFLKGNATLVAKAGVT